MKKTLLCFLFLFTTVFYAQVNDIVHCAGDNNFDLAKQKPLLIGNLNPDETIVSFHLSLSDATNNANAIGNPSNYSAPTGPTTIYVRIDNNGTITTNSFNIKVIAALNITATHTPILCSGDKASLTVTASGGIGQYLYSVNGGSFSSNATFNNLSAGVYSIQVLDTGTSCPTTVIYTITAPAILNATAMVSGQMATITATGGTAPYQYSIDGFNFQSTNVFTNLIPGNYISMVKDSKGCIATVPLTVLPRLAVAVAITKEMDCSADSNASITIAASGGQSPYVYSLNGGTFQANPNFINLTAGTYAVTVRDAVNTISNPTAITIVPPVAVTGVSLHTEPTSCSDASIIIQANSGKAPYYYSIDNGASYGFNNIFNNVQPGTYMVFIKDSKGCISNPLYTVINPLAQQLAATASSTPLVCAKDKTTITVNATGGQGPYLFSLNNGTFGTANTYNVPHGSYFITVKDNTGCTVSVEHIITQPTPIYPDTVVEGQTITINGQAGTAPYQYSVDSAPYQTENVFTNLSAGNHTISLKDAKGCESYNFFVIIADTNPLISTAAVTKQLDCISNAEITITATGGQLPYQYSIDGGITFQASPVFTNLPAGTYTATVVDALYSAGNSNAITINAPAMVIATAAISKATICGESDTVTITATGGKAPYVYSFNESDTYSSLNTSNNLQAGLHNLFVKDSNGCVTSVSILIEPSSLLSLTFTQKNPICANDNSGEIILNASGGKAPYSYSIGNGYVAGNTFTLLPAGDYTVNVKDAAGCLVSSDVKVLQPDPISISTTITNATAGNYNGKIAVTASGGNLSYTYTLKDNNGRIIRALQTSNIFADLTAGSYQVQVTDSNGCTSTKSDIIVATSSVLTATFTVLSITCANPTGTITVSAFGGTAPYQYSIDNGINYTSANVFSNLVAGNYSIRVKDSQGAIATIIATINALNPLNANAVLTKAIDCFSNASINVAASGGTGPYLYSLDNGATYTSGSVFTNINAGSYFIRVKDALGCTVITNSIVLTQPVPLAATVNYTKVTDCATSPISHIEIITTGGTAPYQYSLNKLPYQSFPVYSGAYPGSYILDVKDAKGCIFTTTFTIESPVSFVATATVTPAVNCGDNDTVTITATGGQAPYTYSFDGLNTFSATNTSNNLTAGNYMLHAKDSGGCFSTLNITIVPRAIPVSTITITNTTAAAGNDGSITVSTNGGTAPYTYSLLDGNNVTVVPAQNSNIFSSLAAGKYSVIVNDAKGCSSFLQQVTISSPAALYATTDVLPVNCIGPGTITVNATGGIPPYQYSFDNGITYSVSNKFSSYVPKNYSIKVRDSQNAIVSLTAVINQVSMPVMDVSVTNINCKGDTSGSITANISGGIAPYTCSLNNGPYISSIGNTITFSNLQAGIHTITMKDVNGCMATYQVAITEPATALVAIVEVKNQTVSINSTGGTGEIKYAISPDLDKFSTNNFFSALTPGSYTVIVMDANGCFVMMNVLVDPPAPLIEGKDKLTFEFKPGQTLADLIIDGQNIKWYISQNPLVGKNSKTNDTPLPLTTVLVDGTTYYASQTINGVESKERLAVTAKSNGALSTPDFVLPNFTCYPNPVQHSLTITNTAVIDEVEIFSVTGKSILVKKINSEHSEIDLSNVSSGFYLLKVKSGGKTKTVKIVKK